MFPLLSSIGPERGPHPAQRPAGLALQLAGADLQHGVAEPDQKSGALLLATVLVRPFLQLHDERALDADVRDHVRADFAACGETMGMEGARPKQAAQAIVSAEHVRRLTLRRRDRGND